MRLYGAGGSSNGAEVDDTNRLLTRTVSQDIITESSLNGQAFNINTGEIVVTADSAILYFKNLEQGIFIVDAIAVGFTNATESDIQKLTIVKNPTAGTIVSNAVNVDMNENRNFGSTNQLDSSLAYKGVSGDAFTDGTDVGLFFVNDNSRAFVNLGFVLQRGNSIGLNLDVNLTSGSVGVYAAIIGHIISNTNVNN